MKMDKILRESNSLSKSRSHNEMRYVCLLPLLILAMLFMPIVNANPILISNNVGLGSTADLTAGQAYNLLKSYNGTLFLPVADYNYPSHNDIIYKSENNGTTWTSAFTFSAGLEYAEQITGVIDEIDLLHLFYWGSYDYPRYVFYRQLNLSNNSLSSANAVFAPFSYNTIGVPIVSNNSLTNVFVDYNYASEYKLAYRRYDLNGTGLSSASYYDNILLRYGVPTRPALVESNNTIWVFYTSTTAFKAYNLTDALTKGVDIALLNRPVGTLDLGDAINDNSGNIFAVVNEQIQNSNYVIWFTKIDAVTKAFSTPKTIINFSYMNVTTPRLHIDDTTQNLYLTFTTTISDKNCFMVESKDNGITWSLPYSLNVEHCTDIAGLRHFNNGIAQLIEYNETEQMHFTSLVDFRSKLWYDSILIPFSSDYYTDYFTVNDLVPIQVIKDVDMVNGKTTLIRVPVTFTAANPNGTIIPNVTLYWNSTKIGVNDTTNLSAGQSKNFDFWYIPQNAGSNIEIRTEIKGMYQGANLVDTKTKNVNVVETRDLDIDYTPLDNPNNFKNSINTSNEFLKRIYPISNTGLKFSESAPSSRVVPMISNGFDLRAQLMWLQVSPIFSLKFPERVIAITPRGWFNISTNSSEIPAGTIGISLRNGLITSVIIEEDLKTNAAHELGHTYGLCDEYNNFKWNEQNNQSKCLNGDKNNDGALDNECLEDITGCSSTSFEELTGLPDNTTLRNFMGSSDNLAKRFITNESYSRLLDTFKHTSPYNATSRILIYGWYNKTNDSVTFNNFYSLSYGLATNQTDIETGNFSIKLVDTSNNIFNEINFSLSDHLATGINTTYLNISFFSFVLPFSDNVAKIKFMKDELVKQEVLRTLHPPLIQINPTAGYYSNEMNISWNSSDVDGDKLSHTMLISFDNGTTFQTLIVDYNSTEIRLNTSLLPDCDNSCIIKIFTTDGINTNSNLSEAFSMNNNLDIPVLDIAYKNATEGVFRYHINNTLDSTLNGINWIFNSGELNISSKLSFNLTSHEEIFVYTYNNYSSRGNFTITSTAIKDILIEAKKHNIEVI